MGDGQERLADYLNRRVADGWATGFSVAVTDESAIRLRAEVGGTAAALGGEERPIDARTLFNVGSVTKPVTGTLLAKLVEEGEATLSDKVRSIIPEYPFEDTEVFHLLAHTAGYDPANVPVERPLRAKGEEGQRAYLSSLYGIRERISPVGETARYFTEGYSIVMDLIERVAGCDLESFARETLLRPLGMDDSTFDPAKLDPSRVVFPVDGAGRALLELADWGVTGDSGLYTHADDLLKLGRLFLSGGCAADGRVVLRERTIAFLLADASGGRLNQTPAFWVKGAEDRYGCFGDLHSPSAVGHTGFSGCMLWIDPACRAAGAILTNSMTLHGDWRRYKRINNRLLSLFEHEQPR
ncbi:serine hydrolase domain-containing protein [Cohnella fermenti]|uniref:Beta-lactamase family protein n=1 Tax=Cohnella fermenti TaxID=2565925 RepID=A0A4V3WDV5_9BACL|nr:serine hydrolase domain-containing protein [Cohnella fermenti]THF73744.1 beta-lactamase family protein [Cohnella fermenti]